MRGGGLVVLLVALFISGGMAYVWNRRETVETKAPDVVDALEPAPIERTVDSLLVQEPEPEPSEVKPLALQPSSAASGWSRLNQAAITLLEEGELQAAVEAFEECHAAEPDEQVFAANLAEALARLARALYDDGDVPIEVPIGYLERAVELAPHREDLVRLLARWKKTAETEEDFWTDESAHFLLSYDGSRQDLLKRGYYQLGEMLESAYEDFGVAFNHYPVGHGDPKIRVVLYRRDEFDEVTGIGHWAGGVYDGVVRIPVVDFDRQKLQLEKVLRHELVHAFVRSLGGREVPAWLNEGLAQWFEELAPSGRGSRVQDALEKLRGGKPLFPLGELQGTLASWEDEKEISRAYSQSLAFVDFISRWYGEPVLYQMVKGCRSGASCADTFQTRVGLELDSILEDLARTLK